MRASGGGKGGGASPAAAGGARVWKPAGKGRLPAPTLLSSGIGLQVVGKAALPPPKPYVPSPAQKPAPQQPPPPKSPASPAPAPPPPLASPPRAPTPPPAPPLSAPAPEPEPPPAAPEPEPAVKSALEPIVEPVVEPVVEPIVEPAAEPIVEPIVEPEPPPVEEESAPLPPPPCLDGVVVVVWADMQTRLTCVDGKLDVAQVDEELALSCVFPRCEIELCRVACRGIDMRTAAWDQCCAKDVYGMFFGLIPGSTYWALVREHPEEVEKAEAQRALVREEVDRVMEGRKRAAEEAEDKGMASSRLLACGEQGVVGRGVEVASESPVSARGGAE